MTTGRAVSSDTRPKKADAGSRDPDARTAQPNAAAESASQRTPAGDSEYRSRVLAAAPVAIIAVDLEGVITLVERSGLRSIEAGLDDLVGKSAFELFKYDPAAVEHFRRALAGERFPAVTCRNGLEFDTRFGPLDNAAGERIGAVAVWANATDTERAVATLRESEERFRALTEQATDIIAEVTEDSGFLYVSPRFTELLGYTEREILGRLAIDLIHPDDLARALTSRREAEARRQPLAMLCRVCHRDGSWLWMEIAGRLFRTADAERRGVLVARDVSSRVEIEAALRAQREAETRVAGLTRRFLALGSDEDEIDDAIGESLEAAAEVANADHCYLVSLGSGRGGAPQRFDWVAAGAAPGLGEISDGSPERHAWAYEQLFAGHMIRTPHVSDMPPEAEAVQDDLTRRGVRSFLAIPVFSRDRLHAVLGFEHSRSERDWLEQELALLRLVAELCSSALRRRVAESALRESEERFRALTENAYDSICEVGSDGRFRYANPRFSEITGFSPEEISTLDARELIHPDDLEQFANSARRVTPGATGSAMLYRGKTRDGGWRWFEVSGRTYRSASGDVRSAAVIRDVTAALESQQQLEQRRKLEQEIADLSRRFLELGADEIDEGIREGLASVGGLSQVDRGFLLCIDPAQDVVLQSFEWRDGQVEARGGSFDFVQGKDFPSSVAVLLRGEVLHVQRAADLPAGGSREAEMMKERGSSSFLGIPLLSGRSLIGVLGFESLGGEKIWSDETISLLRLAGEIFVSALRRKQAEQALQQSRSQLLQAQKMEAVGTLAGGVAHDFNNQLSVILGNARYVAGQVGEDPELADALSDLQRAGMHCAQLTRSLLAFSRHSPASPQSMSVERVVADVRELLQPLIPASIEFEIRAHNEVDCVLADPTQLQQVLVNLAVNARDAMPEGGHLWMSTRRRSVDGEAAVGLGLEGPGEYVEFTVRDDGLGMDEETASRVFDPFFTTKELGKGTGLGLATVYGILRESKGAISVESQLGRGSTFRALFPRSGEEGWTAPAADVDDAGQVSETVLLVEDEPAVRRLLRRFLADRGYEVLEAANGADALRVSAVHRGVIDAVVTDVVMPKMGGRELALQLRGVRPEVPVLFLSGYSDDDTELVKSRFLCKPFSQEELLGALRALIDGVDSAA
jgi:two-component system cell cycle sensor histidine kinase/response regulator CckA